MLNVCSLRLVEKARTKGFSCWSAPVEARLLIAVLWDRVLRKLVLLHFPQEFGLRVFRLLVTATAAVFGLREVLRLGLHFAIACFHVFVGYVARTDVLQHVEQTKAAEGKELEQVESDHDPEAYSDRLGVTKGQVELTVDQLDVHFRVLVCALVDDLELVKLVDVVAVLRHLLRQPDKEDNGAHNEDDVGGAEAA